ncbi:hypothetical protein OWR29_26440 [Actinoplanes sp. Pm04-4]|uniref:Transposase n=1 Tax=Paractinoplanes pyxinae TaxID=2997416 RepID=A0ABT4B689_9ACTN|nr:hypothetical protein [Actinoplanes pyxinae]MCY1141552.1 hypothetical protein [Actinoplanes pyxinae]
MEWRRGWTYELRWAHGHSGVRSRTVDSTAKLRAVVEWARTNPHVEKCSYTVTYELVGTPIMACPAGHSLLQRKAAQPYRTERRMNRLHCRACPGHDRIVCPECGATVYDPPVTFGCGPIP